MGGSVASSGPFPVATIPMPLIGTTLTISTDTAFANQLTFSFGQSSYKLPTSVAFPVQSTFGPSNKVVEFAHLYWNPEGSQIGYDYTVDAEMPGNPVATIITSQHEQVAATAIDLSGTSSNVASSTQPSASQPSASQGQTQSGVSNTMQTTAGDMTKTASPTNSVNPVPGSNPGLSSGAVAGVAIGCLIAGALIAGLLVWFCLGRARKRRADSDHESSAIALMHHREKGPIAKAISVETASPVSQAMENGLPQPLEDKAISGEISKISNLIKNHVQSYYHTGRVSPALVDLDDLQALGNDLPISTGTLSTLLGNSDTREIALRFCIAWIMISRMQLHSDPNVTFLPPEVARSFQSMAYIDRGSRVQTVYLARWRALTAELMQSTYVRNAFSPSDPRSRNIVAASDVLEGILRPYADSRMDNSQRQHNLDEILKRAAAFAFTLFSQPSSWDYDWQDEQGVMSGSLCIFPALVQITDETGEAVKPPRAFSEAVVRRLDE